MSSAPREALRPTPARGSATQAIGVFLIFTIIGPSIAAFLAIGIFPLFGLTSLAGMTGDIDGFIRGIGTLMAASYTLGGLQMAAVGLFAAVWHLVTGKPTISLLLILAVSLGVAAVAIVIFMGPFSTPAPLPADIAAGVALHVGAAIGSALIANAFLRRQQTGALAP
jgi:hypothetical protein